MITYKHLSEPAYTGVPEVQGAIERLNSAGLEQILASHQNFGDSEGIPLKVVRPLERADEPLGEFAGFVLRAYGAANGHRVSEQLVLNALVAETTQTPVIGVPFPNRDWRGNAVVDHTRGWSIATDVQRDDMALEQLEAYASLSLDKVERELEKFGARRELSSTGESLGAAVALSIGAMATKFDLQGVSIAALPNVERRHVYRELFARDYARTGSMRPMAMSEPHLDPFIEAHGYNHEKSALSEQVGALGYAARDLFGVAPPDLRMKLYRANRSLVRPLTTPTGLHWIERLSSTNGHSVPVHVGMFENDQVARPGKLEELGRSRCSSPAEFYLFGGVAHEACNNPSIIGYMASRLAVN